MRIKPVNNLSQYSEDYITLAKDVGKELFDSSEDNLAEIAKWLLHSGINTGKSVTELARSYVGIS